jgi:hypothetical protein
MKIVGLDFETYYDAQYSLRKMTPVEYVLDPRFEIIGCAVKDPGQKSYWVEGPDFGKYLAQADKNAGYLSHNMLFDGCILGYRFDFRPRLLVCSMSIARACLGHILRSVSLKSVAEHLKLGVKGGTVHNVIGMNLAAIKALPHLYSEYQAYSCNDDDLAMAIFDELVLKQKLFPISELATLDMVLRCCLQPRMRLDMTVLAEHLNQVKADKAQLLAQAGLQPDQNGKSPDLMSNDKFAVLLENLGVDPPRKMSLTTGKETFAFAKSDPQFIELADHENPAVQVLVGARLGHKSTLEETRTERYIKISRLWWPEKGQTALMPMPLRFSAAHTHRLGGDWKLNVQNLGRKSPLRRALIAPPGETVIAGDASQIEARIVAWLAQQPELLRAFENGEDVYSAFASDVFEQPVNRKLDDPDQQAMGFVGKTGILGLGFGVGWVKFQRTVKIDSKKFLGRSIELTDERAQGVVHTYRVTKYPEIPALWKELNDIGIPVLARGGDYRLGPVVFEKGAILLPNGLRLKYHDLQFNRAMDNGGVWEGWSYSYGGKIKKLYGGALLENIVQAIARILTMDAAVRVQRRIAKADLWLNLQAHDELVYVAPHKFVPVVKKILLEEMAHRPAWALDLPLKAEVGSGASYADAK